MVVLLSKGKCECFCVNLFYNFPSSSFWSVCMSLFICLSFCLSVCLFVQVPGSAWCKVRLYNQTLLHFLVQVGLLQ